MNNLLKGLLAVVGIGGIYYYATSNKEDGDSKETNKNKQKVLKLQDFPTFAEYSGNVRFKRGKKIDTIVTSDGKEIESWDMPVFENKEQSDYWLEILNNEQENIFTKQNKKRARERLITEMDNIQEEANEQGIKTKSKILTYFKEELDEEMSRMSRMEFVRKNKEYIPSAYLKKQEYKDKYANRRRPKNK